MTVLHNIVEADITSCDEFDDGDAPAAVNINPLGEGAAALALYARNRVGNMRLEEIDFAQASSSNLSSLGSSTNAAYTDGDNIAIGSVAVDDYDTIEAVVNVHLACVSAAICYARLAYSINGGAVVPLVGSEIYMNTLGVASPHRLQGAVQLGNITPGTLTVWLQYNVAGGNTMHVYTPIAPVVKCWRQNT